MKVLVTGASGFVGVNLIPYLIKQGLEVRALVRNPDKAKELSRITNKSLELFKGDINDAASLENATQNIDSVFHLAGVVGYSKTQREEMERVNVLGTKNIIESCIKNKIRRLLHFSSVAAVGANDRPQPLNENSKYDISKYNLGYFETKKKAEDLVFQSVKEDGLDAVIVNPSTIYGYADALKGSRKMQVKVAKGQFPFYPPGGVNVVAVEDVAQATFSAWKKGRTGERYILSGENLYIKDVFSIIAEESGVAAPRIGLSKNVLLTLGKLGDFLEKINLRGPINSENARTSVLFHWFDCSKAKKELDFNPRPAREAIKNSVQWMRENEII